MSTAAESISGTHSRVTGRTRCSAGVDSNRLTRRIRELETSRMMEWGDVRPSHSGKNLTNLPGSRREHYDTNTTYSRDLDCWCERRAHEHCHSWISRDGHSDFWPMAIESWTSRHGILD